MQFVDLDYSQKEQKTQEFYDHSDTDSFYRYICGGEDLHVGIFRHKDEDLMIAKKRSVIKMASLIGINENHHILDIGAGYGGGARYLAQEFGCKVTCLNISKIQNELNDARNKSLGLDDKITVVEGSFEKIPFDEATFDFVWSQDALYHSENPEIIFSEVNKVLKHNGAFVFSTVMMDDNISDTDAKKIYDFYKNVNMEKISSLSQYRTAAKKNKLEEVQFIDLSENVAVNYFRLQKKLREKSVELQDLMSEAFVKKVDKRLGIWVDGGTKGYIKWGMMHLIKSGN